MTPQQFKHIRKSMGATQISLCRIIKKSHSSVKGYESGRRPIPELVAEKMKVLSTEYLPNDTAIKL